MEQSLLSITNNTMKYECGEDLTMNATNPTNYNNFNSNNSNGGHHHNHHHHQQQQYTDELEMNNDDNTDINDDVVDVKHNSNMTDDFLSKIEVEAKLHVNDDNINLIFPGKTKSNVWNLFRIIVYKNIRQNFVTCLACNCVLAYKSRTGTASLLRHNCYKRMQTEIASSVRNFHMKLDGVPAVSSTAASVLWNSTNTNFLQSLLKSQQDTMSGSSSTGNQAVDAIITDSPPNSLQIKCEPADIMDDEGNPDYSDMFSRLQNSTEAFASYAASSSPPTNHNQHHHHQQHHQHQEVTTVIAKPDFSYLDEQYLSKIELEEKLKTTNEDIVIVPQQRMKSDIWKRFELIFYRGIRQNYVKCISCGCILSYKKKTGSASLIRHKCSIKRKFFHEDIADLKNHVANVSSARGAAANLGDAGGGTSTAGGGGLGGSASKKSCLDDSYYSNETISNALLSYLSTLPSPSPASSTTSVAAAAAASTQLATAAAKPLTNSGSSSTKSNVPKERLTHLAIQQIYFICKDLGSIAIFNNQTFRNMMQILLDIGADYGRQNVDNILANGKLINTMLLNMKTEIEFNIKNTIDLNYNLTLTFNLWKNYNNNLITIIGYIINSNYQLKKFHLGTEIISTATSSSLLSSINTNNCNNNNSNSSSISSNEILVLDLITKILSKYFPNSSKTDIVTILKLKCIIILENNYDIFYRIFKSYTNTIQCSCYNINLILDIVTNFKNNNLLYKNYYGIKKLAAQLNDMKLKYELNERVLLIIENLNECIIVERKMMAAVAKTTTANAGAAATTTTTSATTDSDDDDDDDDSSTSSSSDSSDDDSKLQDGPKLSGNFNFENNLNTFKILSDNFEYLSEYLASINLPKLIEKIDINIINAYLALIEPLHKCLLHLCCDDISNNSSKTSLNEVYLWRKKLEKLYVVNPDVDSELIRNLKEILLNLLNKYFQITDYHKLALFLDPNFKNLKFLTQSERDSVINTVEDYINEIIATNKLPLNNGIDKMHHKHAHHKRGGNIGTSANNDSSQNPLSPSSSGGGVVKTENDLFLEFMDCSVPDVEDEISKKEIRAYLDTRLNEPKEPLEFWGNENSNFENLRHLVRNILSIPACSFGSKLKFSQSGKKFDENRKTLNNSDNLECIMFLHENI